MQMTDRYENEITDSAGAKHPFALSVEKNGIRGELIWPPENSPLEAVQRVSEGRVTALIVWSTMKIRCWISAARQGDGTALEIKFAMTPYKYRIEDGGRFVDFLASLELPRAAGDDRADGEQPAQPGGQLGEEDSDDGAGDSGPCGDQVYVDERSPNQEHAWYYLVNKAEESAGVTIRRSWMYEGRERFETKRHELYPGEEREVFSFPRNQDPKCRITHCRLD
jgi:hypothetical protein